MSQFMTLDLCPNSDLMYRHLHREFYSLNFTIKSIKQHAYIINVVYACHFSPWHEVLPFSL